MSETSQFAMSDCVFECELCSAVNDSKTAEWCSCISARNTLVCSTCKHCFCEASPRWRAEFMKSGAGTVFLQRRQEQKGAKRTALPEGPYARPLVLIIDDDKLVHMIADRVLADFGGTILHAEDGQTGLDLAEQFRPDLVITDAFLPKLDGREVARLLKTTPETAESKLVVMTALYKGRRYRDEAFKRFHVDEYLEKPVSAPTLRALAARLLNISLELAS